MSQSTDASADSEDQPGIPGQVYRTVTPGYTSKSDPAMDAFGWLYFLGILVLLIPLLPFLLILWLGDRLAKVMLRGSAGGE